MESHHVVLPLVNDLMYIRGMLPFGYKMLINLTLLCTNLENI
jgi:hypothetical protein